MYDMNKLPLRPNVCLLVLNREGRFFLGERLGEPGHWQFPQGGIIPGSALEENALRELEEELGAHANAFRLIKTLKATHSYEWDSPPDYARDKWRGQEQRFVLVEFLGEDSQIDLSRHEPEFMNWKWCSLEEIQKLAEPKRMTGYLAPLDEAEKFLKSKQGRA